MDIREAAPGTRSVLHLVTAAPHGRRVLLTTLLFRRLPLLGFLPCLSASHPYPLQSFLPLPAFLSDLSWCPLGLCFSPALFTCFTAQTIPKLHYHLPESESRSVLCRLTFCAFQGLGNVYWSQSRETWCCHWVSEIGFSILALTGDGCHRGLYT